MTMSSFLLLEMVLTLLPLILATAGAETVQLNSIPGEDSYVAAVVDYHPQGNPPHDPPEVVLEYNVINYEKFIQKASNLGADIIVFPEYGLTTLWPSNERNEMRKYAQAVPHVQSNLDEYAEGSVPCLSQNVSWVIKRISCSARANHIYVVINIPEIQSCELQEGCPNDGIFIFNANIAFNRQGAMISKYHKYNLFGEPSINKPNAVTYSKFTTDFGVTFGMFICFDILFKEPAFNLAKVKNITDIIFPTAWFSELPFLTALQTQTSWALGLRVNLLASAYNDPRRGFGGSGLYSGLRGAISTRLSSSTESKLLVANIPKIGRKNSDNVADDDIHLYENTDAHFNSTHIHLLYENISLYSHSSAVQNGETETSVCYNDFCCQFHINIQLSDEQSKKSSYRFVAYDGLQSFNSGNNLGIQICAILFCPDEDFSTCGHLPEYTINGPIIDSMKISGNFTESQMVLPNSVNFYLKPIQRRLFSIENNNGYIELSSTGQLQNVLTVSIFGRNFKIDE